ncbi:exodeoxyribonuclease VII small subunit [Rhodobacteraceae bacterium]|nr:exodeoxyribonuclease VII small subunit [Paracoccaceae bacterium]
MSEEKHDISAMSFEEAMKAFEAVVNQLDRGDVPLDQSIALYERGAALKARCAKLLKEAEERVEKITLNADGEAQGATPVEGL